MLQAVTTTHLLLLLLLVSVHHHFGSALVTTTTTTTSSGPLSGQAGPGTVGLSLDQPELVLDQPHPAGRLALRLLRSVGCLGLHGREGHLQAEDGVVLGLQLGRQLFDLAIVAGRMDAGTYRFYK